MSEVTVQVSFELRTFLSFLKLRLNPVNFVSAADFLVVLVLTSTY